jgi:hypothetical protein
LPEGGGFGLPLVSPAAFGLVVLWLSVLVPLRVPVSLPMVEPVIELSLPLPPVEGDADELPVVPAPGLVDP